MSKKTRLKTVPAFNAEELARFENLFLGQTPIVAALLFAFGDEVDYDMREAAAEALELIDAIMEEISTQTKQEEEEEE